MIEDQIDSAKKNYIRTTVPDYLVQYGWDDLRGKLTQRENPTNHHWVAQGLIFASLIILFLGSVIGAAQAAKPGDKLYQVKILADDVYAGVLGKYEIKIERRAKEVIDLSTNSTAIDQATRQYKKTLEETQEEAEKSGRKEDFKQTLEAQEEQFKKEIEKNPNSRDHLEEVLKQTEKTRGEVQGEKDENKDHDEENDKHKEQD